MTTASVAALPSHEINTNPASSVPKMAPMAPAANIAPSARPCGVAPARAAAVSTGAGTPAKNDGRKNAASVSPVMPQTGSGARPSSGPALKRSACAARAVVRAAPTSAQPVARSARGSVRSASTPPHQCPAENPASTTAITAVQV